MNVESNKAVVRRYIEMWNTGNIALADEVLATDYSDEAHPEIVGIASVKKSLQDVRAAYPDFQIVIESIIGEDDLVAVRAVIKRTHQGKEMFSRVMWFVRVVEGKMETLWTGVEGAR